MYCTFPVESDERPSGWAAGAGEWFNVAGDLDDFIFFEPADRLPEPAAP